MASIVCGDITVTDLPDGVAAVPIRDNNEIILLVSNKETGLIDIYRKNID